MKKIFESVQCVGDLLGKESFYSLDRYFPKCKYPKAEGEIYRELHIQTGDIADCIEIDLALTFLKEF